MQTLQIRLPIKIVSEIDKLIATGFFRSRSEILRQSIQKYLLETNYNGSLPFIVGPFKNKNFMDEFNKPFKENFVPLEELQDIQEILDSISLKDLKVKSN